MLLKRPLECCLADAESIPKECGRGSCCSSSCGSVSAVVAWAAGCDTAGLGLLLSTPTCATDCRCYCNWWPWADYAVRDGEEALPKWGARVAEASKTYTAIGYADGFTVMECCSIIVCHCADVWSSLLCSVPAQ